jgi:hypothetical protein
MNTERPRPRPPSRRRHPAARARLVAGVLSAAVFLGLGGGFAAHQAASTAAASGGSSATSSTSSSWSASSGSSSSQSPVTSSQGS